MESILNEFVASSSVEVNFPQQGIQKVTPAGNTELHLAAYHGNVKLVKQLIPIVNRVEAPNQVRVGFLDLAGYDDNVEDREMLVLSMTSDIEAGIRAYDDFLRATNKEGNTAFHEAAIGGCYEVIKVLLEHDACLVNIINEAGETALFKAVEEGHKEIVRELLPLTSSQYDRRTSDGQTLVHCAVCSKHKGVLKELIDAKPDLLQQVDNLGRTPLHIAAYLDGMSQIAQILLKEDKSLCYKLNNDGQTALHIAIKEGNLALVKEILKHAKDCMEIVDSDGRNALHLAIENAVHIYDKISRGIKTLVLLVISKRLINQADNEGKTALDIAMDNMLSDERLFTGVKWLLEINGARRTPNGTRETRKPSFAAEKSMSNVQMISVNAVLISTVAFAAAFTLPKENKKHQLYSVFFQVFVICDALAFCISISSAVLLMYAVYGRQEDSRLLNTSIFGLWISLISLLLAFGAGIYVALAEDHGRTAVTVLSMVSIVPILIRILILRSKKYIFREDDYYLWGLLIIAGVHIGEVPKYIINIILVGLMGLLVAKSFFRRTRNKSKERVSSGGENYVGLFPVYTYLAVMCIARAETFVFLICYGIWIAVGIVALIGRYIYFRLKPEISIDSHDHISNFTACTTIRLAMNALFIGLTTLSSY